MATFFGEVLFPNSRAVEFGDDDDLEDAFDNSPPYNIHWMNKESVQALNKEVDVLVIAVGHVACGFTRAFLDTSAKTVAYLSAKESVASLEKDAKTGRLWILDGAKSIVCECPAEPHTNRLNELSEKLCELLSANGEVVILSSSLSASYKTESSLSEGVRFLTTNPKLASKAASFASRLEQPNMLCGLPAAVMSRCLVKGQTATCYVSYVDTDEISEHNMRTLCVVRRHNTMCEIFKETTNTKQELTRQERYWRKDNLYM